MLGSESVMALVPPALVPLIEIVRRVELELVVLVPVVVLLIPQLVSDFPQIELWGIRTR